MRHRVRTQRTLSWKRPSGPYWSGSPIHSMAHRLEPILGLRVVRDRRVGRHWHWEPVDARQAPALGYENGALGTDRPSCDWERRTIQRVRCHEGLRSFECDWRERCVGFESTAGAAGGYCDWVRPRSVSLLVRLDQGPFRSPTAIDALAHRERGAEAQPLAVHCRDCSRDTYRRRSRRAAQSQLSVLPRGLQERSTLA